MKTDAHKRNLENVLKRNFITILLQESNDGPSMTCLC